MNSSSLHNPHTSPVWRRSRACSTLVVWMAISLVSAAVSRAEGEGVIDDRVADVESAEADTDPQPSETGLERQEVPPSPIVSPAPPIGVRRLEPLDHGEWRLAYAFERQRFREIQVGGNDRTQAEVLNGFYQQAPTALDITRHDFGLAYAPHPRVTLVVNVPFIEKELERLSLSVGRNREHTNGIGDIEFAVLVPFIQKGRESTSLHVGVKAPTGSIRRGGRTGRLPYDVQIGNGTWDLEWGWTYRGERDTYSWGAQLVGRHPVGTNGLHYREGSRFNASIWSAVEVFRGLSASLRLGFDKQNNTRGFDRDLDLAADGPSSNTKARGGIRIGLSPGVSLEVPQLNNQRLSVEIDVPIHQDVDGPQLTRDWALKAGWQWVF